MNTWLIKILRKCSCVINGHVQRYPLKKSLPLLPLPYKINPKKEEERYPNVKNQERAPAKRWKRTAILKFTIIRMNQCASSRRL